MECECPRDLSRRDTQVCSAAYVVVTPRSELIRFSEDPNAAVSLAFEGEAVAVYGTMSPDHANMKVTIDGQEVILGGGGSTQISRLHTKTLLVSITRYS